MCADGLTGFSDELVFLAQAQSQSAAAYARGSVQDRDGCKRGRRSDDCRAAARTQNDCGGVSQVQPPGS